MKRVGKGFVPNYDGFFEGEEPFDPGSMNFKNASGLDGFSYSFLARMLFSCLVDADYLCTERFIKGAPREAVPSRPLGELLESLNAKTSQFFPPKTKLDKARCKLLEDCLSSSSEKPGVFSMTVPTGGGKTLSSLTFALSHALSGSNGMRRVIYAIPYTSIIEQNSEVFRGVLGASNVLEHHSSFDYSDRDDSEDDSPSGEALRLATENWEAPVVVTTNVQLFESLFSCKPSRCRKLHNIAGSVIVLDEAQMIPTGLLEPCVRVLSELVHRYGCSVVLCTALPTEVGVPGNEGNRGN